jgi:tRNA G37 N-methylase Trm5
MKSLFNPLVRVVVKSRPGWYVTKLLIRFAGWLRFERSKYEHILSEQRLQKHFAEPVVRSGYFAGLKYTGFVSIGSALFPKLSGTYESELTSVFKNFEKNDYKQIIDVGCAEGYYAVGLALKHKDAVVFAFDIDADAQKICKEMAAYNGVGERVVVGGECTSEWLENTDTSVRKLFICDCEGFERYLFTSSTIPALVNCDLIIELHPMHQPDVKEYLEELFKETHTIDFVTSYDDRRKMFDLDAAYSQMPLLDRARLVQEGRPFCMDWMILSSKQ